MHKKFKEILLLGVAFFAFPAFARADVVISEVAWMGTTDSQYEEWIELHNTGGATSLDGWKIYKASGGTLLISLSGTISDGAYLLVCRTTASVPNPLSGACDIKGSFGGSGLNNTSEHIILENGSGGTVDEINASAGWPAGDSSNKYTMQKYNSSWITAVPTPRATNATTGSGGNSGDNSETEEEEESGTVNGDAEDELPELKIYSTRILKIESPKIAIVGSPAHFKAQALDYDRSDLFKGHYAWNMGDGTTREFALGYKETNDGFDYAYSYPGTYTVSVKYFTGFLKDVPAELEQQFTVEVVTGGVVVSKIHSDGGVELKNTSGNQIDLSGWQIKDASGNNFVVPDDTFIGSGKTVVFSKRITKIMSLNYVSLLTPTNTVASHWPVTSTYIGKPKVKVEVKEEVVESEGEILGVEDVAGPTKEKPKTSGVVWMLSFLILILIAVIAVMLLGKEEKADESYELIDE